MTAPSWRWAAFLAYVFGLLTDLLDGRLARLTHATSPFGRAMDSTADKALVAAGMLGLTAHGELPLILVFTFIFREFVVFGLRAIRMPRSTTIASINDRLGRIRFFVLHVGLVLLLFPIWRAPFSRIGFLAVTVALATSYAALVYYLLRDRHTLREALKSDEHN